MKDWMWWFLVPALIVLAFGALAAFGLLIYSHRWIAYVLMLIAWLGVMKISTIRRSTLIKLTIAGALTGLILGSVFEAIGWLRGQRPVSVNGMANLSFYFAMSFPVLFNLGRVQGKYGLP